MIVIKRSMNPGFAGIENELYYEPETTMLFGDAKAAVSEITAGAGAHLIGVRMVHAPSGSWMTRGAARRGEAGCRARGGPEGTCAVPMTGRMRPVTGGRMRHLEQQAPAVLAVKTAVVIERSQAIAALSRDEFDVAVVGGGITGAGVALDAATRGFSVALLERADFASGRPAARASSSMEVCATCRTSTSVSSARRCWSAGSW